MSQSPCCDPVAVEELIMTHMDVAFVSLFLGAFEHSESETHYPAHRTDGNTVTITDVTKPVPLNYSVGTEWLESCVDVHFIPEL